MSKLSTIAVFVALVLGLASCGSEPDVEVGRLQLTVTSVPTDVQCIVLTAASSTTTAVRNFDVVPGEGATMNASGLPIGTVSLTEVAYAVPCAVVSGATPPTWISQAPVVVQLLPGQPATAEILLVRSGQVTIVTSFADDRIDGGIDGGTDGRLDTPGVLDGKRDTPGVLDVVKLDTPGVLDGKRDTPGVLDVVKLDTPGVLDGKRD